MVMAGKGQRIGYVRVSSADRNGDRHLEHIFFERFFTDKGVSGVKPPANSPESERQVSVIADMRRYEASGSNQSGAAPHTRRPCLRH
jgi:hypothetical protein